MKKMAMKPLRIAPLRLAMLPQKPWAGKTKIMTAQSQAPLSCTVIKFKKLSLANKSCLCRLSKKSAAIKGRR